MPRWRRIELTEVASLDEMVALVADRHRYRCVLVDVDNTLVPYGSSPAAERELLDTAIERLLAIGHIDELVVESNAGPARPGPTLPVPDGVRTVWSVGKPWASHPGGAPGSATVVIGDLDLVDGAWAWRIGASFVRLALTEADSHWFHRLIRRLGLWLRPLLFRTVS